MELNLQQTLSQSSDLSQWQAYSEAKASLLRKTLDQQADTVRMLVQSASPPALPANPAVGRNINTTA